MFDLKSLEGFSQATPIFHGERTLIVRAQREEDGAPVILKTVMEAQPSLETVARLQREFRLGRGVQAPGVIRYLACHEREGKPLLVLEDNGGTALNGIPDLHQLPLAERVQLALQMAEAVAGMHEEGVIHKDLNPSNVIWNQASGVLKLIDLGLATRLARETPKLVRVERLEGTLRYISPEQTGRMNRRIDRRSDLYSLGATLFFLFAGRAPFLESSPLELVHAHIARQPPSLLELGLPEMLSAIVGRLLQKAPEERYQTAHGLVADLKRCADDPQAPEVGLFALGSEDLSRELRVAQKLYGRGPQVDALLGAFERAAAGGRETVLVMGEPGIGKTALVHEIHRPVTLRRGLFLEGKFEQFRLGLPYAPICRAIGQFVRRLLTGAEQELSAWRERYLAVLGANGKIVCELIPELEFLLGPQPEPPALPPAEAENRFQLVFREFLRVHASAQHPLVLFLDDLQWTDLPSLRLIERLATDTETDHLLLLLAYRDNEIDETHPVALSLGRLQEAEAPPTQIALRPMERADVTSLLCDALRRDAEEQELQTLADIVLRKTRGNPFFLIRLLETLGAQGLVRLDPAAGLWRWDAEEIGAVKHSDNVVAFLSAGITDLSPEVRELLSGAACIGTGFDLRSLAGLFEQEPAAIQARLTDAVALELVQPRGMGWALLVGDSERNVPEEAFLYDFVHDRIQQAAHDALSPEESQQIHRRLGQLLLDTHSQEPPGPWFFSAVKHRNQALPLFQEPAERRELAQQNLMASRLARRSAAHGSAFEFSEVGLACLSDEDWSRDYALTLALHLEGAEAAYLCARRQRMAALIAIVRGRVTSTLEQVRVSHIEMDAQIANHDLMGAIETARQALSLLGWELPGQPTEADVGAAVQRAMAAVGSRSPEDILALADTQDPETRAAMEILAHTCTPAYFAIPPLLPIAACALVVLSIERGLSPASPFAFAVYGIVLNSVGMMKQAHGFGELALSLLERWEERHLEARTRFVVNNLVCIWIEPFHETLEGLLSIYDLGRETGDLEFAALAGHAYTHNGWYAGIELPGLAEQAARFTRFMLNYDQKNVLLVHRSMLHAVRSMAGLSPNPARLDGPELSEEQLRDTVLALDSRSAVALFHLQRLILRYHFEGPSAAWACAEEAWPYQDGVASTYHLPALYTYAPLAALGLVAEGCEPDQKAALLARVEACIEQLRAWADAGPINHLHRALLIEAEYAWVQGDRGAAAGLFRQAIDAAHLTEYRNDIALTFERAAVFSLEGPFSDQVIGQAYLQEAWSTYRRWGAKAKVSKLEESFPLLLRPRRPPHSSSSSHSSESVDVDAQAMLEAARAISAELELHKLLPTLFRLSMQAAGAREGFLMQETQGDWRIVVGGEAEREPQLCDIPLAALDPQHHPLSLLRYVLRTGESIVLDDAIGPKSLFADDPYLQSKGVRSVLLFPLRRGGDLGVLLYLEHDSLRGAFTSERIETLGLLSTQATISIENAQLYNNLEAKVVERTQALQDALSQLKEAQSQLVQSEKMASLGTLVAGVAHEINNPTNFAQQGAINLQRRLQQFADFILDLAEGEAEVEALLEERLEPLRENLRSVLEGSQQIKGIVQSLRLFSRLDEAERKSADPIDGLEATLTLVQAQYPQVAFHLDWQARPHFMCYPAQLNQAFMNIAINACQAILEKHGATPETDAALGTLKVRSWREGQRLFIGFEDDGCGIEAGLQEKIFEPFFTTKATGAGAGLGLSIAFGILQQHQGTIEVQSTPDEGTQILLELPILEED